MRKYSQTLIGSMTTYLVTHNLGTKEVMVSVYDVTTGKVTECDIQITGDNDLTVSIDKAPPPNTYRVVVIG